MCIVRMYECTSRIKNFFSQMFQNYSELYLTVTPPHYRLPPERDGPGILICSCVTCRKILDLRKVVYRRIQILMVAAILFR